jgi:hypothetical protein
MLDWWKMRHNNRRGTSELLEKHHMEDIMDATLGRQRQPVGNMADARQHLKWPIELGSELAPCLVDQCGSQAVMKAHPYPIAFYKCQLLVVLIIVALHQVLGMVQLIFDLCQELIAFKELLVHREHLRLAAFIGEQRRWITIVYHLEGCRSESCLKVCVVAVFGPWQPVQPATWLISCKIAKVDSQNPIGHLRLTMRNQLVSALV